jgi:type I restriction enzyme S subunit
LPSFEKQLWFDEMYSQVEALKRLHTEIAAELDALLPAILDRAFKREL